MSINVNKKGKNTTLQVSGDVTIFEISEMWQTLKPVLQESGQIEIDLAEVSNIDTAGIQLLMMAKKAEQDKANSVRLVNHSDAVVDSFELFDLAGYFGDPLVLESDKSGGKS